jgi:hypothetical protein
MLLVYALPVKGRFKVKAEGRELLKFSALRKKTGLERGAGRRLAQQGAAVETPRIGERRGVRQSPLRAHGYGRSAHASGTPARRDLCRSRAAERRGRGLRRGGGGGHPLAIPDALRLGGCSVDHGKAGFRPLPLKRTVCEAKNLPPGGGGKEAPVRAARRIAVCSPESPRQLATCARPSDVIRKLQVAEQVDISTVARG